jgi:hypothetical protein
VYRGAYEACLQVTAAGEKSCGATCQILTYEPDLYLELTWLSPGAPDPTGAECQHRSETDPPQRPEADQPARASARDLSATEPKRLAFYGDDVRMVGEATTPDNGLTKHGGADGFQVKSLDRSRFTRFAGVLTAEQVEDVAATVALCIGFCG